MGVLALRLPRDLVAKLLFCTAPRQGENSARKSLAFTAGAAKPSGECVGVGPQPVGDCHRIGSFRRLERAQPRRERRDHRRAVVPEIGDPGARFDPPAARHRRLQKRDALAPLVPPGDHVADRKPAGRPTEDLLATRHCSLAGRQLHPPASSEFGQLVGDVEARRVSGNAHVRAYAKDVDRRARFYEGVNVRFVQPSAGDDLQSLKAGLVQNAARSARQCPEISGIEANARQPAMIRRASSIALRTPCRVS